MMRLILVVIMDVAVSTDSVVHPAILGVKTKLSNFSSLSSGSASSSQKTSNASCSKSYSGYC
jgi:hypothetical protein